MSDGLRFTVEEFVKLAQAVGQELASNSQDGKFSLDEATSGLSRVANREASKMFYEKIGRDPQGRPAVKKAGRIT